MVTETNQRQGRTILYDSIYRTFWRGRSPLEGQEADQRGLGPGDRLPRGRRELCGEVETFQVSVRAMVIQVYTPVKPHPTVHVKWIHFIVFKLYLNEIYFKKVEPQGIDLLRVYVPTMRVWIALQEGSEYRSEPDVTPVPNVHRRHTDIQGTRTIRG